MEIYNQLKIVLILIVVAITGWRVAVAFGKNSTREVVIIVVIGALVYNVVNDPQGALNSFNGIMNLFKNFFGGIGG